VAGVDKDGNPVYEKKSLSDFVGKGKVMLVDFWSPWCPPCKAEIPNIKAVWEKYHGDDFDVLSVAVWEESRKMDWHNTIDTAAFYGIKWQQLNNGHQEPASLYGIEGIPHMILFDKDGTILKRGDALRGSKTAAAVAEVLGR
jgi:thiol-disulfide isomerase/thioredoxin